MIEVPHDHDRPAGFACDMTALAPERRAAHQELSWRLFGSLVKEMRELLNGYAFCFGAEHYTLLAEFIAGERLCCPFLTFRLEVAPEHGPLWLELTAHSDVKAFLWRELSHALAAHCPLQ